MKKRDPYAILIASELEPCEETRLNQNRYTDLIFSGLELEADLPVEFNGCVFRKTAFNGNFRSTQFIDCILEQCDLSNADFTGSRFHRVRFDSVKAVGTTFNKSLWSYVRITGSNFCYTGFDQCKLNDCVFIETDFSDSVMSSSGFQQVTFQTLDFSSADLSDLTFDQLDLSSCQLQGVRLSPDHLRGLMVSMEQAVAIAELLGVKVKNG